MRLLHLSDLHLGRSLQAFSLLDEQKDLLTQILDCIKEQKIDALLLCGDVYDKATPSLGAVEVLNRFLTSLSDMHVPALIIAGNHDSPERLGFLNGLIARSGVYLCGEYTLGQKPVTLEDEYGPVDFHLLPFFRPGAIRSQAEGTIIANYDDAVRVAVEHMPVDASRRNVLLGHQFVYSGDTRPTRSDSEVLFIGGTESVSAAHFDPFDYVALGHLHHRQAVGSGRIYYAGSPLKYSIGEAEDPKGFLLVELGQKGEAPKVENVPVKPLRDLHALRGTMEEVLAAPVENELDYFTVTLTDENPVYDAMLRLRARFPHAVSVRMERDFAASSEELSPVPAALVRDPVSLFEQFYRECSGREMTDLEREDVLQALKEAEEGVNA